LIPPTPATASEPILYEEIKFEGRTSAVKRWAHASVSWNNQVVVFGGFGGDAKQQRLNDILILNTQTNNVRY
jgi:hypothetical protein